MEIKTQSPVTIADIKNQNKDLEHVALGKDESDEESDKSESNAKKLKIIRITEEMTTYHKEQKIRFEKALEEKQMK